MQGLNLEIKHAPGRTIQAVDALSCMPSGNVELSEHPNRDDLSTPLNDEAILHVAVEPQAPSISDLVNLYRSDSGQGDLFTDQAMARATDKHQNILVREDRLPSDDERTLPPEPHEPLQVEYPNLLLPEDEKLMYDTYINNDMINFIYNILDKGRRQK